MKAGHGIKIFGSIFIICGKMIKTAIKFLILE